MKIASLCADIDISGTCFAQNSGSILVVDDIHKQSLKEFQYNHQYENLHLNPRIIQDDLSDKKTQQKIVHSVCEELGNEPLNLPTAFLPTGKALKANLLGIGCINIPLKTKMIYIDALPKRQ